MAWLESRIQIAEQRIEMLYRRLQDLLGVLDNVRQQLRGAFQQLPSGGGSSPQSIFAAMAPGVGTIAGTWSGSAPSSPGSFTGTVYQLQGSAATSVGSFTVTNWLPAALVNGKACLVVPDGAGNFVVVSQSCT